MTSIRSTGFAGTPIFLGGFRILSAALVCAVFFSGCSDPPELEQAVPPVQNMVLAEGVTENFRRFPGEVSAVQSTEMSFDVAGRLIERPATQGAVFQQGDLLAGMGGRQHFLTDLWAEILTICVLERRSTVKNCRLTPSFRSELPALLVQDGTEQPFQAGFQRVVVISILDTELAAGWVLALPLGLVGRSILIN